MSEGASVRDRAVLVTGATGFLGGWLTNALVERGARVVALVRDHEPYSNFHRLGLDRKVAQVHGDLVDRSLVERAVHEHEVEVVVHLAAQTQVGVANRAPLSTFRANVEGTWNLLEACRAGSKVARIVVASSDKAYGASAVLPYTEETPLAANHPYDASKAMAEILCRTYHHTYGMPIAVTRCANLYGGGDLNFARIVPDTARALHERRDPVILSDGTPVRDYVHVDDVVAGYLRILDRMDLAAGKAFNLGTNDPISVLDLVTRMIRVSGATDRKPVVKASGRTTGEIDRQFMDSAYARKTLGWEPKVSLDDGLRRAIAWYAEWLASPSTRGSVKKS